MDWTGPCEGKKSWILLVPAGNPWRPLACNCISLVPASVFSQLPSLGGSASPSPVTTPVVGLRAHPHAVWPHLNLMTSSRTLFPKKVTFIDSRQMGISGDTVQLSTLAKRSAQFSSRNCSLVRNQNHTAQAQMGVSPRVRERIRLPYCFLKAGIAMWWLGGVWTLYLLALDVCVCVCVFLER